MSDPKCARLLMKAAENDLRAFRSMKDRESFSEEVAGFHAQQAAEKLVKAWLALLGFVFPLTHDIETLLDLVRDRDPDSEQFRDLEALTPFAVVFRYEGAGERTEPLDRDELVRRLETLYARVQRELPE